MKKNGFISVTVIYTFFLVFLSLMLYIVTNLVVNRNLLNNMKTTIKNELNDSNFNRYLINHCNDLIRMDDSYNNSIKEMLADSRNGGSNEVSVLRRRYNKSN